MNLKTIYVFGFVPIPSSVDGEPDIHSFCVPGRVLKVFSSLDPSWLEWAKKSYVALSPSTARAVENMQSASALPASYLPLYAGVDSLKDAEPNQKDQREKFLIAMKKLLERMAGILEERSGELDERFAPFACSILKLEKADTTCMPMQKLLAAIGTDISHGVTAEESASFDVLMGACIARMGWGPKEFRESFLAMPEQDVTRVRTLLSESDRLRARLFVSLGDTGDSGTPVRLMWWGGKPGEKDRKVGELQFFVRM